MVMFNMDNVWSLTKTAFSSLRDACKRNVFDLRLMGSRSLISFFSSDYTFFSVCAISH